MKRLYAAITILILASLFFSACRDTVGLGMRLNLNGPIVTILKPSPNRNLDPPETDPGVGTLFNLSGTAESDSRVALMTVTLDYWNAGAQELVRMGREWKWDNYWMTRESDDSAWKPYSEADYDSTAADPNDPASPPSWALDGNNVSWNLPISMYREEKGDYFITVSAWDATDRHGSESAKKLKVKFNDKAPTVKIRKPVLRDGAGGSLSSPRPPAYDEYVFDPFGRPEQTSQNLRFFTNDFRDLSYEIESEVPPTALSFEITNEHDLDNYGPGEKVVYYDWRWQGVSSPPKMGTFTDDGNVGDEMPGGIYTKAGERIELADAVKAGLPKDTITPMQLVTQVRDSSNLEEYKSKGWFLYLPDSDKPYVDISFGYKVLEGQTPPPGEEWVSMTRGSTNNTNSAYDDDGLKQLQWTLYKLQGESFNIDESFKNPVTGSYYTGTRDFDGLQKEQWPFQAVRNYGVGNFKIKVRVQDIYGVWGDDYHAYFKITSNSTPTVMDPLVSPPLDSPLWGDANGNFLISGKAQIEDKDTCDGIHHDVRVDEVAIAWIKPGLGDENDVRYSFPDEAEWDNASESGFTDSYGNKIWKVAAADLTFVDETAGNNNPNSQEEWAFFKELNLFNDLGIGKGAGKIPFSDQVFRIRVLSRGTGTPLSSQPRSITTRGDMQGPVVVITHITVQDAYNSTTYPMNSSMIPAIKKDDKVKLTGTWRDDSIGHWTGLGANRHNTHINNLVVSWEGENHAFTFEAAPLTLANDEGGTWETSLYTFEEPNADPIIQLTASLTDLGERLGTGTSFVVIETDNPTLTRISSITPDGYYGNNKQTDADEANSRYIDIFLEFNKPISFCTPDQEALLDYDTAPRLLLNNGGEAFYYSGNGANRIYFRYFVNGTVWPSYTPNTGIGGQGGGSTPVDPVTNPEGRLNVTDIVFSSYPKEQWKSINDISVTFPENNGTLSVCNPANIASLVGQKRIIIDKTPPQIENITFNARTDINHGEGSQIRIYVEFNKNIQVTGSTTNTLLNLTGGNLADQTATAGYENASANRITFLYAVGADHDTSSSTSGYTSNLLGVSSMVFSGASITDLAGNSLTLSPVIPAHTSNVVIDTTPPSPPVIGGIFSNRSYYGTEGTTFRITGLESPGVKVEYHLNYPTSGPVPDDDWNEYSSTISQAGQTGDIDLKISGIYYIAARQYDTAANTPNCSAPSIAVVGPVRVDTQGGLLERITSSDPDGIYSADSSKNIINIDLEFRIPVTLAGGTGGATWSSVNLPPIGTAYIALNTTGSAANTNRAKLISAPDNSKKWTFEYTIPTNAVTPSNSYLNVSAINLDALTIYDQPIPGAAPGASGTRVNEWIDLEEVLPANKLNSQNRITVISGRPRVLRNTTVGAGADQNTDIQFNGTQSLSLTFDRDIYRGDTAEKLIIRQIAADYRIPAVLTEQEWQSIFVNRTDMFAEQSALLTGVLSLGDAAWQTLGNALYQKGTNGADGNLASDTTVKYVLKHEVDPGVADNNSTEGLTGTGFPANFNMGRLRDLFRAAEALTFGAFDREVDMTGTTLTIDLGKTNIGRPLPVKGAYYEWIFPNGFVKDFLGSANGGTGGDSDNNLTSGATAAGLRVLFYSNNGVEVPVIRIDKGSDIETFNNPASANRQALQPLQSKVKINSRTPGAAITYWKRETTDNASKLIMRPNPVDKGNQLPNRNSFRAYNGIENAPNQNQIYSDNQASYKYYFDNTRMRPQSGRHPDYSQVGFEPPSGYGIDPDFWRENGQNWWEPMSTDWGTDNTYSSEFTIGSENYSDGGMIVHIQARARLTGITPLPDSAYSYESAYRSVFVYINQNVNTVAGVNNNGGPSLNGNARDRVWIRGSDNTYGNPTTPDFPISMDSNKWRKIRLLTPINAAGLTAETTLTAEDIPPAAVGNGNYLWFWVTWKINVPAFLHLYYGQLPASTADAYQTPRTTRELTLGSVGSLEHFAIIPGRTTAIETRPGVQAYNNQNNLYNYRWYGHSGNLTVGSDVTVIEANRTD